MPDPITITLTGGPCDGYAVTLLYSVCRVMMPGIGGGIHSYRRRQFHNLDSGAKGEFWMPEDWSDDQCSAYLNSFENSH